MKPKTLKYGYSIKNHLQFAVTKTNRTLATY